MFLDEASAEAWFEEVHLLRAGCGLRKGAAMGREAAMTPTDAHPARIAERFFLQREECRADVAAGNLTTGRRHGASLRAKLEAAAWLNL